MALVELPTSITALVVYTLITLTFASALYRLSWFHPLHQYPGPTLSKITGVYPTYFAFRGSLHLKTYENFQKYGPVIRQSPNRLLFNTITAAQDIYLSPKVTKGRAYSAASNRAKFPSLLLAVDRADHRRKRKLIAPSVSQQSMQIFEPDLSAEVNIFLKELLVSSRATDIVNISKRSKRLGLDIVGKLAFGHAFNTQTDAKNRYFYQLMEDLAWRLNLYMQFWPLRVMEFVLFALRAKQLLKFDAAIRDIVKTRMKKAKGAHHDLYSIAADGMHKGELWPESVFFLTAGGATSAAGISAAFFYLSRNPKAYTLLAAEIRSNFHSAAAIRSGPKLSGCRYLRACIDESLRLSPPFLPASWRELDDGESGPLLVDGHTIPRGTQVAVSPYSILHNEEYFPDAYSFSPERWLEPDDSVTESETDKKTRADMRKAFIPFLLGNRSCAGKPMAYLELTVTIARTMWFFDFETAPGEVGRLGEGTSGRQGPRGRVGEYQLDDFMVARHDGPNLLFHARGNYWQELEAEV